VAAWLWISDEAIAAWRVPPGIDAPMKVKGSIERSAGTSVDVLCQKASLLVRRWAHARRRCHHSVLLNRRARRTPIPLSATSTSRRSRNGIGWDGNARSVMAATSSAQLRCRVISPLINLWDRLRHTVYRALLRELPLHAVPSMLRRDFINGLLYKFTGLF
jgi:hypothetical protein